MIIKRTNIHHIWQKVLKAMHYDNFGILQKKINNTILTKQTCLTGNDWCTLYNNLKLEKKIKIKRLCLVWLALESLSCLAFLKLK